MADSAHRLFLKALLARGNTFELISDFAHAQQDFSGLLGNAEDVFDKVNALLGSGKTSMKSGAFSHAFACARKAGAIARSGQCHMKYAHSLILESQILLKLGKYRAALKKAGAAKNFLADSHRFKRNLYLNLSYEKVRVTSLTGLVYCYLSDYGRAIPLLKKALVSYRQHEDAWNIAVTAMNLGNAYIECGLDEKALDCFQESLNIKKRLGDRYGISNTLHNMSRVYGMQGKHDRALRMSHQALAISREIHDANGEAGCYVAIGIHNQNLGRLDSAYGSFTRALKMVTDRHDPYLRISAMLNIAGILLVRGRFSECRRKIALIEREAQRLGNAYLVVNSLNLKAEYLMNVKETRQCFQVLKKSVRISNARGLVPEQIIATSLWVRTIVQNGKELSRAESLLKKGDRLIERYSKPDGLMFHLPAQIEYYSALSDSARARVKAQQLFAMARKNNNGVLLPRAYYYLALVRKQIGRSPGSYLRKAERLAQRSGMKPLLRRIAALKQGTL